MEASNIGDIGEINFVLYCKHIGLCVLAPHHSIAQYDYIVDSNNTLHKVQVKTTSSLMISGGKKINGTYKVNTRFCSISSTSIYSNNECDIIAVYLLDIDIFYLIPVLEIKTKTIYIRPDSNKCKFKKFKNNWQLLE